jgi:fructosamine-3-kinase
VLTEHADSLDEVTEPVLVDWDLWESNVMIRDGAIVCVIDHERAFFGDPLMEAGFFPAELAGKVGDEESFTRGYGRAPVTEAERTRRRLYNLYLILIMVIEPFYRGHPEPTQYGWAKERLARIMAGFGR